MGPVTAPTGLPTGNYPPSPSKEEYANRSGTPLSGSATLFSSGVNLLKTIIGAGIVSLPLAIYAYGYVFGILLMFLAAAASYFGLHLYIRAAAPLGRSSSPFSLAAITYPRTWLLLDLAIVLKSLGVALAYLILIGQLMSNFMNGVLLPEASPIGSANESVWIDTRVWVALFMIVILPLSFLRRMDHLRYSSFLGLGSIIYLTVLSFVSLLINPPAMTAVHPFPATFGVKLLSSFGVFVFAFTCHQNIFPLINETKKNAPPVMSLLSAVCISLALLIYLTYGVSSYLAFADRFDLPNAGMFSLYDTSAPFQLARLLFAFLLAFSYPLQVLPFRSSFERLLMLDESTRRAHAFKIYLASTSLLLVLTFGIAMCNPSLQKTLSLVGSMTSSVVCYILPSLYYYKAKENDPWTPTKIGALILGIFGGLVFVICTISSIVAFFL